jgi:hypothetical protein
MPIERCLARIWMTSLELSIIAAYYSHHHHSLSENVDLYKVIYAQISGQSQPNCLKVFKQAKPAGH